MRRRLGTPKPLATSLGEEETGASGPAKQTTLIPIQMQAEVPLTCARPSARRVYRLGWWIPTSTVDFASWMSLPIRNLAVPAFPHMQAIARSGSPGRPLGWTVESIVSRKRFFLQRNATLEYKKQALVHLLLPFPCPRAKQERFLRSISFIIFPSCVRRSFGAWCNLRRDVPII
jgi:hypothetical protein